MLISFNWKGWKKLAIIWSVTITILFCIPGTAFPKQNWLSDLHFDKWVHFGFFAILVFCWRFYFPVTNAYDWLILFFALIYGILVEIIQHHLIKNRAFDVWDVIADMTGAVAGLLFWWYLYKKDKPL